MNIPSIMMVAAASVTIAGQATAQTGPIIVESDVPTVIVSYADLDITSVAGRHTLEGRAIRAAAGLCLAGQPRPIEDVMVQRQCYSFAMSHARLDIDLAVARAKSETASQSMIRVAAR